MSFRSFTMVVLKSTNCAVVSLIIMQLCAICGWEGNCNCKMSAGWNFCPYLKFGSERWKHHHKNLVLMPLSHFERTMYQGIYVLLTDISILGLLTGLFEAHGGLNASNDLLT